MSTDSPSLHARAAGEVAEVVEQEAMFSVGATSRRPGGPVALAAVGFAMVLCFSPVEARRTSHCFTCRSRGPLGDCRDAFPYNETTAEGVRGVEATPCASKWCGKLVEGKDDDFDLATERLCLQRPPDDQEERCAETLYQNRRVYMCFCRGDLCNGAHTVKATGSSTIALILATTAVARYMMQAGL